MKPNEKLKYWLLFFIAASLEGGFALAALLQIPGDPTNNFFLGLSLSRFLMALVLLFLTILFGWIAILAQKRPRWQSPDLYPKQFACLHWLVFLGSLGLAIVLFLFRYYDPVRFLPFYERAVPLGMYLLVLGVQTSIWLLFLRFGLDLKTFKKVQFKETLIVFTVLLGVFLFVSLTRLGLIPDTAYWGEPGVVIQSWQFGLALSAGVILFVLSWRVKVFSRWADIGIALLLWGLAVWIWSSVPMSVLTNSYYAPYAYPIGTSVPYSDSGFYDYLAQGLLLGEGFITKIPPRPLYIVFLAGAHALYGFDYAKITFLQILVIAFLPVAFYWIAKKLHSRPAGIVLALFVIAREWTSLVISSQTRVANTRMILTDLPTVLALAVVMLAVIHWLQKTDRSLLPPLIAGGTAGMLLLLRTQSMLIFPAVILLALLLYFPRWKEWATASAIFLLGILLIASPWLIRNAKLTGKITFDDPAQLALLSSQYGTSNTLDTQSFDFENESLSGSILDFALSNPAYVARFISSHFFATEISALLALPLIFPFSGFQEPLNIYWTDWNGGLSLPNLLLLLLYLSVISFGISAAWKRLRWIGLVPLLFSLVYALSNGVARFSGWRYSLPADWVGYFYFALGFIELLRIPASLFGFSSQPKETPAQKKTLAQSKTLALFATISVFLVLVGSLPLIIEKNIQPHFSPRTDAELTDTISAQNPQIAAFAAQEGTAILQGNLIWARYYVAGNGLTSSNPWPVYVARDYPRTGFIVLNDQRNDIVFPHKDILPELQSGLDVIVLGCEYDNHLEARFVYLIDSGEAFLSDRQFTACTE